MILQTIAIVIAISTFILTASTVVIVLATELNTRRPITAKTMQKLAAKNELKMVLSRIELAVEPVDVVIYASETRKELENLGFSLEHLGSDLYKISW